MNELNLSFYNLTELTESDLIALCYLNNVKPEELEILYLTDNKLANIDFIQENIPFINLKELYLYNNYELKSINNIKYLKDSLIILNIRNLNLDNEYETIKILKTLKKLRMLYYDNTFKLYTYQQIKQELSNREKNE